MNDLAAAKSAARKAALAARASAHATARGAGRQAAGFALEEIGHLRHAGTVAAYLPFRTELDTMPLIHALQGLGFRVCLPVVVARTEPLEFRVWSQGDALALDGFGLRYPVRGEPTAPQVLIVPLLAFDASGHRLGYGGGFYDRTLAALRARGEVHAYGFAYEAQRVDEIPRDARDAVLQAVITERGVVRPT
jgi:5-formyltetrahydrofolate cyclo-ligase